MSENTSPEALQAAREQADEFESFLRPLEVPTRDGRTWLVTHPNMLDDDASEEYQQLRWLFNQCDRVTEEVPETRVTDKDGNTTVIEAHTVQGGFIDPYQKDGQRITPSYNIQMAKILLGDKYEEAKAAGVTSNAVAIALSKRADEMRKRRESDSKSADSNMVSAPLAESD